MTENLNLEVRTGDCSARLRLSSAPGVVQDRCVVTVAGLVKIRIVWPQPAVGVGVASGPQVVVGSKV